MGEITVNQLRKTSSFPQEWEEMTSDSSFVFITFNRDQGGFPAPLWAGMKPMHYEKYRHS